MQLDGDFDNDTEPSYEPFLASVIDSRARSSARAADALCTWTATYNNQGLLALERSYAAGRVERERENAGFEWVLERTPCRRPALRCGHERVLVGYRDRATFQRATTGLGALHAAEETRPDDDRHPAMGCGWFVTHPRSGSGVEPVTDRDCTSGSGLSELSRCNQTFDFKLDVRAWRSSAGLDAGGRQVLPAQT
jgi:hypothetical protein